jgi:hypothetical protein
MHTMKTYSLIVASAFVALTSVTACGSQFSPSGPSGIPSGDQTGSQAFSGLVIASENASAVADVLVTATRDGISRTTATNIDGEFAFDGLSAGEWTVSISHPYYVGTSQSVQVGAQEDVIFAIDSQPEPTGEDLLLYAPVE